jgi:hypothetical protein
MRLIGLMQRFPWALAHRGGAYRVTDAGYATQFGGIPDDRGPDRTVDRDGVRHG